MGGHRQDRDHAEQSIFVEQEADSSSAQAEEKQGEIAVPAFFPFAKKLLERRAARALPRVAKQLASLEQGIFHHMRGIRVGAMDVPAIRPRPAYRPAQILPANFVRTAAHRAVKTKAAELCGALQNISQKIAAMQKPSELVVP